MYIRMYTIGSSIASDFFGPVRKKSEGTADGTLIVANADDLAAEFDSEAHEIGRSAMSFVRGCPVLAHSRRIGYDGGMSQFTLQRLLVSIALISVGAGVATFLNTYNGLLLGHFHPGAWYLLWCGAGAIIGGAVFCLSRRPVIGAAIGALVQSVIWLVLKARLGP
jgi:hypothetical protein